MRVILIAAFLATFSTQALGQFARNQLDALINDEWNLFKITYNKTYASPEIEAFRRENFIQNRAIVANLNQRFARGEVTFQSQINAYSDMLFNEFNQRFNGLKPVPQQAAVQNGSFYVPAANAIVPGAVDWRELGAVTPVKNQGSCASCYAFATADSIAGQHYRKTGQLLDMSPQDILDCSRDYENEGCNTGTIFDSMEYCVDRGIAAEATYPYQSVDQQCRPRNLAEKCTGYVRIADGDEKGMQVALATMGPIAAGINAVGQFQNYMSGIINTPECGRGEDLNHAVLIVGYGEEANGQKYWLCKNSYGPQWGEGGFFKVARDVGNLCGIASQAAYPLV